jgi:hypothetical protein
LYGDEVEDYDLVILSDNYVPDVDFQIEGKLVDKEFQNLIDCLKASTSLKRKIRRYLFSPN